MGRQSTLHWPDPYLSTKCLSAIPRDQRRRFAFGTLDAMHAAICAQHEIDHLNGIGTRDHRPPEIRHTASARVPA